MESIRKDIQENYDLSVHYPRQNRHIVGTAEYLPGRSILTAEPQMLIDLYAGKSSPIVSESRAWVKRERFEHTHIIGIWISRDGLYSSPTNKGVIHYSKNGVHVVPGKPSDI